MGESAPKYLGKYKIIEEIGRGGFAVVYKAQDTSLDRIVALKVLAPHLTWDPTFSERFHREAKIAAQLRHPHIVTVYEVGEEDGQLYIAMEYLPGRTLQEILDEEGPLSLETTIAILEQVADALDYAHEQGVVHRDVKPANIIVGEKGRVKLWATLTDFGLVKAIESSQTLTSAGAILGSPEYMAPEQADPERRSEIGPATDRYSLGVVAYRMLTGRVPFPGNTPATLNAHLNLNPPDPRSIRQDLPAAVATVLLKALSKAPADRYPSATAMVEALRKAAENGRRAREQRKRPARPKIFGWAWAVGMLIIIALAALTMWLMAPRGTSKFQSVATPTATREAVVAASSPTPTSMPTVTATSTPWPTSTPEPTATATPRPTPTATPVPAPTSTHTPEPTGMTRPVITVDNAGQVELLQFLPVPNEDLSFKAVAFSPDGQFLVSAACCVEHFLCIWDVETGKAVKTATIDQQVEDLAFSPDGRFLASVGYNPDIALWNTKTWQTKWTKSMSHPPTVLTADFSPDGQVMVTAGGDTTIYLWSVQTGEEVQTLGFTYWVESVAFSPDGRLLASGGWDNAVQLWDVETGKRVRTMQHPSLVEKDRVESVAFSPDGDILASGAWDGTVRLWRVSDGTLLHTLEGHAGSVVSVAFSPDGTILASGSYDGTVRLWEMSDGTLLHSLEGHTFYVNSVAFSPDGTILASAGSDGVRLWGIKEK